MKAKTLLQVDVSSSPERTDAKTNYIAAANPITTSYGGNQLSAFIPMPLGHEQALQLTVLYEFPDSASILALFEDVRFKALQPMRERAFSEIRYTVLKAIES